MKTFREGEGDERGGGWWMVGNLLLSNLCHNFVASASRANSLFSAGATRRWPQCTEQEKGDWWCWWWCCGIIAKRSLANIIFYIYSSFLFAAPCLLNVYYECYS